MTDGMPDSTYCEACDERHSVSDDGDGYGLANCPKRGTVLAYTPGSEAGER